MAEVMRFVDAHPVTASSTRIRICLIVRFVESVRLRWAKQLSASLKDIRLEPEGRVIQIHGKDAKSRIAQCVIRRSTRCKASLCFKSYANT